MPWGRSRQYDRRAYAKTKCIALSVYRRGTNVSLDLISFTSPLTIYSPPCALSSPSFTVTVARCFDLALVGLVLVFYTSRSLGKDEDVG